MDASPAASISFVVPGDPVPFARAGGGKTTSRFTPAKQRNYSGMLRFFCSEAMKVNCFGPIEGPVEVMVRAIYGWPRSWSARKRATLGAWKTSRSDLSNIVKLLEDALNSVAWVDDAQIVSLTALKFYSDAPRLEVIIRAPMIQPYA